MREGELELGSTISQCYSSFSTFLFHGVSTFNKVGSVLQQYRPAVLLSFFEPIFANFVNSHDSPIKIITAASQGSLSAEKDDIQRLLILKLLWHANVGKKGRMIPFCQYPLENAIPQIVSLPCYTTLEERRVCSEANSNAASPTSCTYLRSGRLCIVKILSILPLFCSLFLYATGPFARNFQDKKASCGIVYEESYLLGEKMQ